MEDQLGLTIPTFGNEVVSTHEAVFAYQPVYVSFLPPLVRAASGQRCLTLEYHPSREEHLGISRDQGTTKHDSLGGCEPLYGGRRNRIQSHSLVYGPIEMW